MEASNTTPNTTITLQIKEISCAGLPRVRLLRKGAFYLVASLGKQERRTDVAGRSKNPSWSDVLIFNDIQGTESLVMKLMARHGDEKDGLICQLRSPIGITPDIQDTQSFTKQSLVNEKDETCGTITFTIERLVSSDSDALKMSRGESAQIERDTQKLDKTSAQLRRAAGAISDTGEAIEKIENAYDTWQPLVDKIELVILVASTIAEIHPYGQMVWSIISPVLKAVAAQAEKDQDVLDLIGAMNKMYNFVDTTKPLEAKDLSKVRQEIVKRILQQTYDCAWFIYDYISHGFFGRGLKAVTTNHDTIMKKYKDAFSKLKSSFLDNVSVDVAIMIHRTFEVVQETRDDYILDEMAVARGQELPKECLYGTREDILTEIIEWIHSPVSSPGNDQCMYWLHGVAGCGKSTIASTIARRFSSLKRCAWYFFDASNQAEAGPDKMFSTLSRSLADIDAKWRQSLVEVAKESRQLRTTMNVKEQFENFILRPAAEFEPIGPIVIVIDALDESGSRDRRAQLLQTLVRLNELNDLGRFRFLVTSRLEDDIQRAFASKPWILSRNLADIDDASTDHDIRQYVMSELSDEQIPTYDWPKAACIDLIVSRAEHLFQWAFVACNFVKGTGEAGIDPGKRYHYLHEHPTDARLDKLDLLYIAVLKNLYGVGESDKVQLFRMVLGRVLSAREPLSLAALTELRQEGEASHETQLILGSLCSLLKGVVNRHGPILPLHASFLEFLQDPKRCGNFYIESGSGDEVLAHSSLRIMNSLLKFNMCNLKSSYARNRDIVDLPARVKENIPEHLTYACRHFGDHISALKHSLNVQVVIETFLYKKLLFWLEASSLLGDTYPAQAQISALHIWIEKHELGDELSMFTNDAERFVRIYSGMMARSTPHIYFSSLAFIPSSSPLHQRYLEQYPGSIKIAPNVGSPVSWTSLLLEIKLSARVLSVRYSPNGKHIVSSSNSNALSIWDAHTGQLVIGPLEGHTDEVCSVDFSPDGKHVVSSSCDKTLRVWSAYTGELVAGPLEGHTELAWSVGFSPDGKYIVSGSDDCTIRVWDALSGRLIAGPFEGHTDRIQSVKFSPDGKYVASGSQDSTIRVWDVLTGQLAAGPLEGHTSWVNSIEFSPDGIYIVSGSSDNTIRVWNMHPGQPAADPFQGHASTVYSVGFSPDGKYIVSGSSDKTIRIWGALTRQLVSGPFKGHTDQVYSVQFSPDGKYIISGSDDCTIRVWDINIAQPAASQLEVYPGPVNSVAFSPDGKYIVSGSEDNTFHVWDALTGQLVSSPFEGYTGSVNSVGFSPDGKYIVSGSDDCIIRAWETVTGQLVAGPFEGHAGLVLSVGFSPDGKYIVSGSSDKTIRVWDVLAEQLVPGLFQGHTNWVRSVGFSPDGRYIVSGSDDCTIRVWNALTGELVSGPFEGHTYYVLSVGFSPDGQYIVSGSGDKTIRVWDTLTGQLVAGPFQGHTDYVRSVGFSPDGQYIVSGSDDMSIRVWDARTGQLAAGPFEGHINWVKSVMFSPDGKYIVSGSYDSTIRVWGVHARQPSINGSNGQTSSSHSTAPIDLVEYTNSSRLDNDGWMCGPSGELIFWVPPIYRLSLYRPSNTLVIGRDVLKLDLDRFAYRLECEKCYASGGDA